ncbi:phosphatase PAP2 family protein [Gardnerella swidsinskii]|uniref:Phosphatase PAP2 family protein n=1 Tax=Gardnerella swidsinskii TaxID=2792979 RepID=A0A9X7FE68_9BIFI|nr:MULTISPECIES: phosphatase PAP2 family protein [Gardnerella]APW19244.1 phosphoesterase [Gardnerella vaginalis]MDK6295763.1 phosphatase PAP2 family protein [Gardnerella swidsinskii]MDK8691178.1 phosphatase PAP2 family protein [Gardnerella swidsinskii]NSX40212.1 phosphatase PAP2 family protein [Gardnerella vaginalis]NSX41367.1 phosphatase PAP2 family protein [Gardnerella vaginalis]
MSEEFAGIQSNSIDNQHDDSAEKNDALPVGGTSQDVNRNSEGGDYSHPLDSINTITPFSPISSEDNDEKISPLFPENNEEKSSKQSVKQFVKQTKRQSDLSDLSGSSDLSYSTNQLSSKDSLSDADDIDQLGQLVKRPRISTILWCVAIAIVFLASAAFIWFISVQTVLGQSYEEMVIDGFGSHGTPSWLAFCLRPISVSMVVIVTSIIIALVSLIVVCIRKRWWLLGQCAGIIILSAAAEPLKKILPRPMLISIEYLSANSAPSGHTLLITASCALLICAVSRVWRAWAAVAAAFISVLVELSLVAAHWHRVSDVLMSLLIVGAVTLIMLACTRSSGMDMPAYRRSSISVQIVGSSMITIGVLACLYALYLIWQILPGVDIFAQWAASVSYVATYWLIIGVSLLVFGVIMVMRHSTASPLSRLGLVGAPPTPPSASK